MGKYGDKLADAQEVWDWANANIPRASLERIMRDHWTGALSGYDALVKEYLINTKPNTLPQGAKTRTGSKGEQLISLPGKPEVRMEVAVRLGWL